MKLRLFLRSSIWDFLLVCVIATSMNYVILSGFDSADQLRFDFLLQAAIDLPVIAILFAGSWSKRFMAYAAGATAVAFIAVMGIGIALTPGDVEMFVDGSVNDVDGNYAIFCFAVFLTAVVVYLLTRRVMTASILFVLGLLICASVQFLFSSWLIEEGGVIVFLAFLLASGSMIVYQRYRTEAVKVDILVKPAFFMAFLQGLLTMAICVGLGLAGWMLLIVPLQIDAPNIEPFSREIQRPVVEYSGTFDQLVVEDPNLKSRHLSDNISETQQNAEGGTVPNPVPDESAPTNNPLTQLVQSMMTFNSEDWTEDFDPSSVEQMKADFVILPVVIAIAIVLIVTLRRLMRIIRLKRWEKFDCGKRVQFVYGYLLRSLGKLGFKHSVSATPLEYAFDQQEAMVPFTRGTGKVDFIDVTLIYQKAAFGMKDISRQEWEKVERYYKRFFKNARDWVGSIRWIWYFWRV